MLTNLLMLLGLIIAAILGYNWIFWIVAIWVVLALVVRVIEDLEKLVQGSASQKVGAVVDLLWQGALIALAIYIYNLG